MVARSGSGVEIAAMTQHRSDDHRKKDGNLASRQAALTGWAVFRPRPWHFVGVFGSREEAERRRERAGADYQLEFGTANLESGEFDGAGLT